MARLTYSAPHDRLTRMCEAMTTAMDAHPEARDGDKAIVFLLSHLQSMFEAAGHTITIVPVENVGPPNLN
jgi:hypothetical protein